MTTPCLPCWGLWVRVRGSIKKYNHFITGELYYLTLYLDMGDLRLLQNLKHRIAFFVLLYQDWHRSQFEKKLLLKNSQKQNDCSLFTLPFKFIRTLNIRNLNNLSNQLVCILLSFIMFKSKVKYSSLSNIWENASLNPATVKNFSKFWKFMRRRKISIAHFSLFYHFAKLV